MYKTIDEENEAWDDLVKWSTRLDQEIDELSSKYASLNEATLESFLNDLEKISSYVVLIKAFSGSFTKNIGPNRGKKAIVALVNRCVDEYVTFSGEKLALLNDLTSYRKYNKILTDFINKKFDAAYSSKWFPGTTLSVRLNVEVEKIIFVPENPSAAGGPSVKEPLNDNEYGLDSNVNLNKGESLLQAILNMQETQMLQFKALSNKNSEFEMQMRKMQENSDKNLEKILKSSETNISKLIDESNRPGSGDLSGKNGDLAKTIAAVHSHSNLSRFDLPKEEKYNGHDSKLIPFIRHITNKIIPLISDPAVRWDSVLRNITNHMVGVARQCAINADDYEIALNEFVKRIIEGYGHRFDIAVEMINDFLNSIHFDHNEKLECLEFLSQTKTLKSNLEFIGASGSLHNFFFLQNVLTKLPMHVKNAWIKYEAKKDNLIRKIFVFSKEHGLMYNVNKKKNPNYEGVDRSEQFEDIKCPNPGSKSHEISFNFAIFIEWFEECYLAGGIFKTENVILSNVNANTSSEATYGNDRDVGNVLAVNENKWKPRTGNLYGNREHNGTSFGRKDATYPSRQ